MNQNRITNRNWKNDKYTFEQCKGCYNDCQHCTTASDALDRLIELEDKIEDGSFDLFPEDLAERIYKNGYEHGKKDTAKALLNQLTMFCICFIEETALEYGVDMNERGNNK